MAADAILDFKNFIFLTVGTFKKVKLHDCTKFRQNRSHRGRDIAIFRLFKMAVAAILDFQNFEFLTFGRVTSDELRHCAKFRRNRSKRGRDMCINIMLVWLENAYSLPFWGRFGGTFPPNDVTHRPNPKKDHPWAEPRHLSHKPRKLFFLVAQFELGV